MTRECVVCGRPLKTGRKYCYTCRSLQKAREIKGNSAKSVDTSNSDLLASNIAIAVFLLVLLIFFWKRVLILVLIIVVGLLFIFLMYVSYKKLGRKFTIIFLICVVGFFIMFGSIHSYLKKQGINNKSPEQIYSECNVSLLQECNKFISPNDKYQTYSLDDLKIFSDSYSAFNWANASNENVTGKKDFFQIANMNNTKLPLILGVCHYTEWTCYYGQCRYEGRSTILSCNRYGVIKL